MPEPLYTILVSNEPFKFTRSQLESEPDNYFLTYFFGSFVEAEQGTNELAVEKEPILFKLIQAHLRGYNIFPIPDGCVPSYMTKEVMVENLLMEADFYGLMKLVEKIKEYQTEIRRIKSSSEKKYIPDIPRIKPSGEKKYMLKGWSYSGHVYHQYLDREEYFALFQALVANSMTILGAKSIQYLGVPWPPLPAQTENGYSIRTTWKHNGDMYYSLLVQDVV